MIRQIHFISTKSTFLSPFHIGKFSFWRNIRYFILGGVLGLFLHLMGVVAAIVPSMVTMGVQHGKRAAVDGGDELREDL
jgi:hypothetical protein